MKNITVSVTPDVYRRARMKAAERDSSVSKLVREFLIQLAAEESEFERRQKLQDEILSSVRRFQGANRVSREKVHARRAVR